MAAHEDGEFTSPPHDLLLGMYVHVVNSEQLTFGITLNVSGIIVSGTLIGWREYMRGIEDASWASGMFSDESGSLNNDDTTKSIVEAMKTPRRVLEASMLDEMLDEHSADADRIAHIHLGDAQFYSPDGGAVPTNGGEFWRGRLSSVDGFVLGVLTSM